MLLLSKILRSILFYSIDDLSIIIIPNSYSVCIVAYDNYFIKIDMQKQYQLNLDIYIEYGLDRWKLKRQIKIKSDIILTACESYGRNEVICMRSNAALINSNMSRINIKLPLTKDRNLLIGMSDLHSLLRFANYSTMWCDP